MGALDTLCTSESSGDATPCRIPREKKTPPSSGDATPCCIPQRETLTGLDRAREEESQSRENPESESHIERKGGRAPFNHAQVPCSITLHPIKLQVSGETFSLFSRFGSRKSIRDSVIHEHAPRSALTGRATPASRSPRTAAPDAVQGIGVKGLGFITSGRVFILVYVVYSVIYDSG